VDFKSHHGRQAVAELGKCGKFPSVGYSEADEVMHGGVVVTADGT